VDPGSLVTGWGIVEGDASRSRVVDCGVIRLRRRASFPDRLHQLQEEFASIVEKWSPASAAVETPFHGANARSALQLAHARGVLLAVLAGCGVKVTEYTPAVVKKSVTGNGRAAKDQVRAMVRRLLDLGEASVEELDVTDALAVAICHLAEAGIRAALSRSDGAAGNRSGGRA
jgi:crossover junction endodeoxyribonuclease RuvC